MSLNVNYPLYGHSYFESRVLCLSSHAARSPEPRVETQAKNDKSDLEKGLTASAEKGFGDFGKGTQVSAAAW